MIILDATYRNEYQGIRVRIRHNVDTACGRPWEYELRFEWRVPTTSTHSTAEAALKAARDDYRANKRYGFSLIDSPLQQLAQATEGREPVRLDDDNIPDWVMAL